MLQTHPLYFSIESVDGPAPEAGMFIVCWPEQNGDGRFLHNAHPNRRAIDSEAGDELVHRQRQERYRMFAVQRFNDWNGPWFASVRECLASIAEADRQRYESHRGWWIAGTPVGGRIPGYYASPDADALTPFPAVV